MPKLINHKSSILNLRNLGLLTLLASLALVGLAFTSVAGFLVMSNPLTMGLFFGGIGLFYASNLMSMYHNRQTGSKWWMANAMAALGLGMVIGAIVPPLAFPSFHLLGGLETVIGIASGFLGGSLLTLITEKLSLRNSKVHDGEPPAQSISPNQQGTSPYSSPTLQRSNKSNPQKNKESQDHNDETFKKSKPNEHNDSNISEESTSDSSNNYGSPEVNSSINPHPFNS